MSERREELGQKIKDYNSAGAKMRRLEQQLADVGSINLRLMEKLAALRGALEEIAASDHLGNRWARLKAQAALKE